MKNRIEHLRGRYDTAFQTWAEEMTRLQQLRSQAQDTVQLDGAESRATSAESTYRETRDQLAREICTAAHA